MHCNFVFFQHSLHRNTSFAPTEAQLIPTHKKIAHEFTFEKRRQWQGLRHATNDDDDDDGGGGDEETGIIKYLRGPSVLVEQSIHREPSSPLLSNAPLSAP